jgi:hypothetical protein
LNQFVLGSLCESSPQERIQSQILAKVLRPAEAKTFHGYVGVRPEEINSIDAVLEYTSKVIQAVLNTKSR